MNKTKVLFLIQSYPSVRSANVLCDDKIIRQMIATGQYEVHCLVHRYPGQSAYEEVNGVIVHRQRRSWWSNLVDKSRANVSRWYSNGILTLDKLYLRLRQVCYVAIYPDTRPLLARSFSKSAKKLYEQYKFDLIVAEHNGRETAYAGAVLKQKHPKAKLVTILWDPMSGKELAPYLPHAYAYKMMDKDELRLLRFSDRVICLKSNEEYQKRHSTQKPFFNRIRFLDIPGIVQPSVSDVQCDIFTKKGYINILYSGVLTLPLRDPSGLISILNKSKYASKINLMFFSTGFDGIARAKSCLKTFQGTWLIHSYIPKAELDAVASKCDVFVNLGGSNPVMVPSKIFDYMSLGKPIVSTYYVDNESSKSYLEHYPLALCLDTRMSVEHNVQLLDGFLDNRLGSTVPFAQVEKMFPLNTPGEFLKVFNEVL